MPLSKAQGGEGGGGGGEVNNNVSVTKQLSKRPSQTNHLLNFLANTNYNSLEGVIEEGGTFVGPGHKTKLLLFTTLLCNTFSTWEYAVKREF